MSEPINKEPTNPKSYFAQYIEPATILTLTIAAVYLIGWSLMGGYFHRIGIPQTSLELPIAYYLERGSGAVITVWLILGCVIIGAASNKFRILFRLLPLLLIFTWVSVLLYTSSSFKPHIIIIAVAEAIIIGLPVLLIKPEKLLKLIPNSFKERIILAIFAYTLLIFGARYIGSYIGERAIEGESYTSIMIVFTWKDTPPPEMQDKSLILILHNGGKYYVVEKQNPASKSPAVFIIPDDLVKYASIKKIN